MASFGSRRGEAGSLTVYLMVGAFLVAGGFFVWLSIQAAPVEVVVVEGDEESMATVSTVVDISDFGMNPMAHAATVIELRRLGVLNTMPQSSQTFFVGVPGDYLVKMLPEVAVIGGDLEYGATVSVTGTVYAMTDSAKDAWMASGGLAEGDRILADFAESFIEVRAVSVTAPPQPDPCLRCATRQGRFAATVEPKTVQLSQNRVDLVFEVTEGPKSRVRKINIIGNEKKDILGLPELFKHYDETKEGGSESIRKQVTFFDRFVKNDSGKHDWSCLASSARYLKNNPG